MTKKEIWICPICGFKMFKVVGGIENCPKCGYTGKEGAVNDNSIL